VLDVSIRVDRALIFIGTLNMADGEEVVSEDEFHDVLVRVVERAASALGVTTDARASGDSQADAAIAAAALSTPEELGADWTQFRDGTDYADFRFDSDASSSSRCTSFLDTVFAPMNGGVTDNRLFFPPGQDMQHIDPVRQHVTVLADKGIALAAWRAMASPDFQACALTSAKMFDALRFSTSQVPPFVPDGNHVAIYHFVKQTPGLEDREFVAALIQVGRTITYLDAMQVNWLGEPGVSDEQFAAVSDRVTATTEQALSA
jgi:hypothetical protein